MWRLVVTPQFPSTPQFPFNININANNQTIGKYTDIARYNRVFILYHNSAGSNTVTLTLPSSLVGKATLSVYGPFQTLAVSGGPSQTITTQSMITTIKYKTSGSEYFYIQLDQTD